MQTIQSTEQEKFSRQKSEERQRELNRINQAKRVHDSIKRIPVRLNEKTVLLVPEKKDPAKAAEAFRRLHEEYLIYEKTHGEPYLNK